MRMFTSLMCAAVQKYINEVFMVGRGHLGSCQLWREALAGAEGDAGDVDSEGPEQRAPC